MNFCTNFKDLRKESGLSAKKLALMLGYSKNIVYEWEKGRAEPTYTTLCHIAKIFDVTVDYLIGNDVDEFGSTHSRTVAPIGDTLTQDEQELLKAYVKLSATNKKSILIQVKALSES